MIYIAIFIFILIIYTIISCKNTSIKSIDEYNNLKCPKCNKNVEPVSSTKEIKIASLHLNCGNLGSVWPEIYIFFCKVCNKEQRVDIVAPQLKLDSLPFSVR